MIKMKTKSKNPENKNTTEDKNMPVYSIKNGQFKAAVFQQTNKKGEEYRNISFQKSYTKDEGKTWEHQTINLNVNDILKVISVLSKVYEEECVILIE